MNSYEQYSSTGFPWCKTFPTHWDFCRAKYMYKKENRHVSKDDDVVTCFRDGMVTLRKNRRLTGFTEAVQETGSDEVYMIEKTVLDRFYDEDDLAILKEYVVPEEGKKSKYAISYGVFLGYNFGILSSGRGDDELLEIMQEKLEQDAQDTLSILRRR